MHAAYVLCAVMVHCRYVLLGGVNDSLEDAQRLVELTANIYCMVCLYCCLCHLYCSSWAPPLNSKPHLKCSQGLQGTHAP